MNEIALASRPWGDGQWAVPEHPQRAPCHSWGEPVPPPPMSPVAGGYPDIVEHPMDLTPAETTLIDILRNAAITEVMISITRTEDGVVVTMAIPGDGVNIGAGPSFEAAFFDLCGREMPALCQPLSSQH